VAEGARFLRLAPGTLRSWVVGREYPTSEGRHRFTPLIKPAGRDPLTLSFLDLLEAHVLRALRIDHRVKVVAVRKALRYAEQELGLARVLLNSDLRTHAGKVFLERYGHLIELSASGQLAMRKMFEDHLSRVDWAADKLPLRLYPFVSPDTQADGRPIAIDANIAFGRPVLHRAGISTSVIAGRLDAGETVTDLAADYDVTPEDIEQAVLYERAA
jgi:uncharacterized protein (DUF433 family)